MMSGTQRKVLVLVLVLGVLAACASLPERDPYGTAEIDPVADALEVRKLLRVRGYIASNPDRFASAEQSFSEARRSAEQGDLTEARRMAAVAAQLYREAFLAHVKLGRIPAARRRLAEAPTDLPPGRIAAANAALNRLEQRLADLEGEDFDLGQESDFAFNSLVSIDVKPDAGFAPIDPCPDPVQPQIEDLQTAAPPPGRLLSRDDIHYLVGRSLDISFRIPGCTQLTELRLNSPHFGDGHLILDTDAGGYDPIENSVGVIYYYEELDSISDGAGGRILSLRLHLQDFKDGRAFGVQLTVESVAGSLSSTAGFTLSQVAAVRERAVLSISEAALRNGFIAGIYQDYGDDGQRPPQPGDDLGRTLKNPSYKDLRLEIRDDGIHFAWQVEAVIDNFCDAHIGINGIFHLERNGPRVDVIWDDDGPHVGIDTFPCVIPAPLLLAIQTGVLIYFEGKAEDTVRDEIQARVDQLFDNNVALAIVSLPTRPRELQIELDLGDTVTIEVPYGTRRLDEAIGLGLPVKASDDNVVVTSGLPLACFSGEAPPQDCSREIGMAGLFNWNINVPVPSPWPVSQFGTVAYFKERHRAWKELKGLRRVAAKLPFGDRNVGALVVSAEMVSSPMAQGEPPRLFAGEPCKVSRPGIGQMRLGFGANDHRFLGVQELGVGVRRITVAWPTFGDLINGCPQMILAPQLLLDAS